MKFCPKCGGLMVPKSPKILECPKCGTKVRTNGLIIKEKLAKKVEIKKPRGKPKEIKDTLPITEIKCPRCGNNTAYWWVVQTRAADEPETQFYRCTKCGYTWREYL